MNTKLTHFFDKVLFVSIWVGLFLLICLPLFVSDNFYYPYVALKGFSLRFIIEGLFIFWTLLFFRKKVAAPTFSPPVLKLMFFIGFMAIINTFGVDPFRSHWGNLERMEGLTILIHFLLMILVIGSVFKEKKYWLYLINFSFLISFLVGSIDIKSALTTPHYLLSSTLGNSGYLGIYMAFHFFFSAYLYTWAREQKKKWAIIYLLLAFSYLAFLVLSGSRGTQLGLVLGSLIVISILNFKKKVFFVKKNLISFFVILLIALSALWFFHDNEVLKKNTYVSRILKIPEAMEIRGRIWSVAIEGIKEKPLLGWGQENFSYVFDRHYNPSMGSLEPWFDRAHNVFLDWFLSGGLIGGLLYISVFFSLLNYLWKSQTMDKREKAFFTGLIVCYLIHNFFIFDNLVSYLFIFLVFAYISQDTNADFKFSFKKKLGLSFITIGLFAYLVYTSLIINISAFKASRLIVESLIEKQAGNYSQSIEKMRMAINENSVGTEEAIIELSKILVQIKSNDNSNLEILKTNAEREPLQFKNQFFYASYLGSVNHPDSEKSILNLINNFPTRQLGFYEAIKYYTRINNYTRAFEMAKRVYDLDSKIFFAARTYALLAILNKQYELSERIIRKISPSDFFSEKNFLKAYLRVGENEKAIDFLKKRIFYFPTDPENYNQLGIIFERLGKQEEAQINYKKAQDITQNNFSH